MALLGLKRKREHDYQPLHVLTRASALVPTLEFLVKAQQQQHIPDRLLKEATKFVEEFDYGLPRAEERVGDFGIGEKGTTLQGRKLRKSVRKSDSKFGYVLSRSIDAKVMNCMIIGNGVLTKSIRPVVNGSVVIGNYAFDGDRDTFYRPTPDNQHYFGSPNFSFRSVEQYQIFVKMLEDISSGNPENMLRTLLEFSKTVAPEQHAEELKRLGSDRKIIPAVLDNLYNALPQDRRDVLGRLGDDERVIVAARLIYNALNSRTADTYQVSVDDSVVYAEFTFNYVKGGAVKNSIIAGRKILEGTNITVANSYLVTPKGTRFVESQVFGNPEAFDKVPLSLTDRKTLFERIAPYRDPAIQWFRSVSSLQYAASQQPK